MRIATDDSTRRRRMAWLYSIAAVISLIILSAPAGAAPADAPADLIATVTAGAIRGIHADGIQEYLGVPFAASTAGADRFAPPRPAPQWTGIRPAATHSPQCPQSPPLPNVPALQPSSEDCLTIDLYVPEHTAGANLPVMVWLYGGAFVLGSNAQYDSPARLVREGQVIVAIPNYRVGPFGFLALPELAADNGGITGTYGTLDQQAALRWIRDNATVFGGDPGNVTLFGESAGGMSVCTQLASPSSRGLYAKAIVESGSCARSPLTPPTKEVAYQRSADYAASIGCGDPATRLRCLRESPVDQLLSSPTTTLNTMDVAWSPVRDEVVVTSGPEDALANDAAQGVPLIVGSNAGEGATFIALLDYARGVTPAAADYAPWAQTLFNDDSARILDRYPLSDFVSPAAAKAQVITDGFFACPALFTAEAARRGGARVWQYQFNDAPLGWNPLLPGAFHGAEVPYVFSALMGVNIPLPPAADLLSRRIQQSWAQFAHTGNPEIPAFAPWPSDTSDATLELGSDHVTLGDSFSQQHHCDLWSDIDHIG
ncbi:carboxylesterase/lipase family protein [Nocardia aurantiaca]|uniref:Carboxylic ester hydrolase n=1 Tax=Nocardia aurantiaca TaxID=2675850 RepID=A0A6I3KQ25_9NOCA|nr:carboxylesterase family protein [Nocardia aurantiaca]MTE11421.1 carboxylesterase family protein [Nocardia aurantiaca]